MNKSHLPISIVLLLLFAAAVCAQERAREMRGAQPADVDINLKHLVKKRRSEAFQYFYISTRNQCDFDLGQGGVSHQKWEDVWIVPLRYAGEDNDRFVFVEQIQNEPFTWAFDKRSTGTRCQIFYQRSGESDWILFDDSATQERRYQPNY